MQMGQRIVQVDAFTGEPFAGNPAAVCVLDSPREDRWMAAVAREMNLAETAFLVKENEAGTFGLRWFTPTVEVDLCGHATLASAHVLWEEGHLGPGQIARFRTRSGELTATQEDGGIVMDFPARPAVQCAPPAGLLEALGLHGARYVGKNSLNDYILEVESENVVRGLEPDIVQLRRMGMRGVIVTSRADIKDYDFVSRFFAPGAGVDEDPVTGSAHCCLAPYWSEQLGKDELVGFQASARGGRVGVRCRGERVFLSGQAVTVLRGELID
jgi:PhzF family phenazine biosynthesis protein